MDCLILFPTLVDFTFVPRATLTIDDISLLKQLAKALQGLAAGSPVPGALAGLPFHPSLAKVRRRATFQQNGLSPEKADVIAQALGSDLTYIWGPPGTGKTYVIARLVSNFVREGKRVLVTSHTHTAVDQVLYELIKPEGGPLADHESLRSGRLVRLGESKNPQIPPTVRLREILGTKGRHLEAAIRNLDENEALILKRLQPVLDSLHLLDVLAKSEETLSDGLHRLQVAEINLPRRLAEVERLSIDLAAANAALSSAKSSFLFRNSRTNRAAIRVERLQSLFLKATGLFDSERRTVAELKSWAAAASASVEAQRRSCASIPDRHRLNTSLADLKSAQAAIDAERATLRAELAQLAVKVLSEASAVFCTLTKNYSSTELATQPFDAVIVDEVSMALPPLVFLAAHRATTHVILVGDFLQLPPVVRSDTPIANERLKSDVFRLSGIVQGLKPSNSPVLRRLSVQHRMATPIADVARLLAYKDLRDDPEVWNRDAVPWHQVLPTDPVLVVDTADCHCWSGKQPGSLSRFNFYSAVLSVRLAAIAAGTVRRPKEGERFPIGVVTPFAAQRRLLCRQLEELGLDEWVLGGTVDTFQGNEADLIIFDSVLDEPYWSARLCNPRDHDDVIRDLNVAVTRARQQLIFVGSSAWLNAHARGPSGLGTLWEILKERARLVPAYDLIERTSFAAALHGQAAEGWRSDDRQSEPMSEILDEESFFPRFQADLEGAAKSIFGLVPYFGQYRWPRVQPWFSAALAKGVEVTLVTPPSRDAQDPSRIFAISVPW
jgi:hypothetical protein